MAGPPLGGLRLAGSIGVDAVGWCPSLVTSFVTNFVLSFAIIHLGQLAKLDHGDLLSRHPRAA